MGSDNAGSSKDHLEDSIEVTTFENISIFAGWENDRPILIVKNNDRQGRMIHFLSLEQGSEKSDSWEMLHLPFGQGKSVQLPTHFEKWEKFGFRIGEKPQLAPISALTALLNQVRKHEKPDTPKPETEASTAKQERSSNPILEADKEDTQTLNDTNSDRDALIDYQHEASQIVRSAQERVVELARTYRDGEPIDLDDIEAPTPSQKVLLFLNSMGRDLSKWITKLEQTGEANHNLIDTLKYREKDITDKLKKLRGDSTPVPKSLELETDINTDTELEEIKQKCKNNINRFEGRLIGYEERCKIDDLSEYDQFILQFIKDRLFNGVARFVSFQQLPEQIDAFLRLVGYEVVPIEIGKTQVDARVHDIQGSRQTEGDPGTIVEVILPGLRQIIDGEIVQKPVVIRGE